MANEDTKLKDIDIPFTVHTYVPLSGINKTVKTYMQEKVLKKIKRNEYLCERLAIKFTDDDIELENFKFDTKSGFVKRLYEKPRIPHTAFRFGEFTSNVKREILSNIFFRG